MHITDLPSEGIKVVSVISAVTGECLKGTHTTMHTRTHTTQPGLSCLHWVLLFCLCPADGGSEHVQAKWFVSGSGETALLRAQSAPRRKHYLYPLSRSSLHRNSQYQPSPREWVRRTHVHTCTHTTTYTHTCSHLLPQTQTPIHDTNTHTLCCTARGLQYFLLSMVVSPRLARCSCVCNVSSLLFSLILPPFQTAPSPDRLCSSGLTWSGSKNPALVPVQNLFCCWVLVGAGGSRLFSLCLRCPDRNGTNKGSRPNV